MMQTAPAAAAVVKALRATEKRMAKSLSKNKKINYSSTKFWQSTEYTEETECLAAFFNA